MEYKLQFISSGKVAWLSVLSLCYGLGGIKQKWIRRFLGALWIAIGIFLFAKIQGYFKWWVMFYPALFCAALHLGYGAEETLGKIKRRALYGFAFGISAIPLVINSHLWVLFAFHCVVALSASVVLGVFNPTRSARDEETLVAVFLTIIPMFLI